MADDQDFFDTLVREFSQGVRAVESRIAAAAPGERPRMEHQLHEVLASVSHMNPLGRDSASLREAPSPDGLYSRANIDRAALDRLDPPLLTQPRIAHIGQRIVAGNRPPAAAPSHQTQP